MDSFDQYLFEELTSEYAKPGLSADDYEELYMRFCNIDYLDEVQPYLLTMRYFGLGTAPEKKTVLSELKEKLGQDDYRLIGLYYDLVLTDNPDDNDAATGLLEMIDAGYTGVYTKDRTNIDKIGAELYPDDEDDEDDDFEKTEAGSDVVSVDYMTFECREYSGLYFTAGDIDYLNALVYINPFNGRKHITVSSQIYLGSEPFSRVFYNEYDITPETRWLRTQGWGNTNFNCYRNNTYRWVIQIDGKTTYSRDFYMYNGRMNKTGPKVKAVELFASKASGALERDRENYRTIFDGDSLEYVYFKFLIHEPGSNMNVQPFIKITCMEDNSVFWDGYFVQPLNSDTIAFWYGIGYTTPGRWPKGLYHYSVHVGNSRKFEGTFNVC